MFFGMVTQGSRSPWVQGLGNGWAVLLNSVGVVRWRASRGLGEWLFGWVQSGRCPNPRRGREMGGCKYDVAMVLGNGFQFWVLQI
jgi:hypothetical protein